MTRDEKIIRNKVGVLELAKQLGSVSHASAQQRPDIIPLFDREPTSRRPDLPADRPARAAKVKDGRRPPPKAARSVVNRSEHDGTITAAEHASPRKKRLA